MNSLYERHLSREALTICQDRVYICTIFICVIIIISFRKLDLIAQTSNICDILSPLYHAYFQQIALAVFKIVKLCLMWDFFCGFSCWTPRHQVKSLVLSGIGVKAKFLWSFNTAKTAYLGKIWYSSYGQNWLSANEISVVFNPQYFINRLISDFDFWNVDRHEW